MDNEASLIPAAAISLPESWTSAGYARGSDPQSALCDGRVNQVKIPMIPGTLFAAAGSYAPAGDVIPGAVFAAPGSIKLESL